MNRHGLLQAILSFCIFCFLPTASGFAETHVIQKGDTLWSIARRYYGDPKLYTRILELNPNITLTHQLRPGDIVYLDHQEAQNSAQLPKEPQKTQPAMTHPRPFSWSKEYHPDDFQYIVSISDVNGEVFFTHPVPPIDKGYRDRRVNKKPGERKTITELHDQEHPYSDCDPKINSKFHNDELYRLLRQDHPAIKSQLEMLGEVTFKDINGDGMEDLIIEKGSYGALDMKFVDILIWSEDEQTFVATEHPYLTSAANVISISDVASGVSENAIIFTKQVCQTAWIYYKYIIDGNHQFHFSEAIREECSRHISIGEIYKISEKELEAMPFICEYSITDTENGKYVSQSYDQLSQSWQDYIKGKEHPSILKARVVDYPTLFKRNHTLHFDSEEEAYQWMREHNAFNGLPF